MEPRLTFVALLAALVGAGGGWWLGQSESPTASVTDAPDATPEGGDVASNRPAEGPALDSNRVALQASEA